MSTVYVYNETTRHFPADTLSEVTERLLAEIAPAGREVAVILLTDEQILEQNYAHRGEAETTDVLSYSLLEGAVAMPDTPLLGDVFISLDTAERQAAERGISLFEEVLVLAAHGMTHLLGFDHQSDEEWAQFITNQQRALRLGGYDPAGGARYRA